MLPHQPEIYRGTGKTRLFSTSVIHEPVELAVIATPPQTVPGMIESCGNEGMKAAVIINAGFREAGLGFTNRIYHVYWMRVQLCAGSQQTEDGENHQDIFVFIEDSLSELNKMLRHGIPF